MNRLGFLVLSILQHSGATGRTNAMTVGEIMDEEVLQCESNTVYKKIREFQKLNYIDTGLKDGRAFTFFITQAGEKALEREKEEEHAK